MTKINQIVVELLWVLVCYAVICVVTKVLKPVLQKLWNVVRRAPVPIVQ